jgi:CcmD family protein
MEQFLHDNSLYVVLGIALILWFGLGFYMFSIDRKVSKLEKQIATNNE